VLTVYRGTAVNDRSVGVRFDSSVEVRSLHDEEVLTGTYDAALGRYGPSRVDVITGDHANSDTGPLTLGYRLGHLHVT